MSEPGIGIGARLQAARERADLSVVQVAELLHVDPSVIQALETERFSELGAAVYVRGHMRHYAELLRESAPELLALYAASVSVGPPPDLTLMPHAPQAGSRPRALLTTGLAVVIGVGLIGAIRSIYLDLHPVAAPVAASAPAALSAPEALDVPGTDAPTPATATNAAPAPPPAVVEPVVSSAPKTVLPAMVKAAKPAHVVADATVTLKFRSACWTEVFDARGGQLYRAIGAAGAVENLRGAAPLRVMVGNFSEVDVEINGQAQVVPVDAQSGRSAEFLVTQDGELQPVRTVTTAGNKS
jgi:cytoskeleton protein RodZ